VITASATQIRKGASASNRPIFERESIPF